MENNLEINYLGNFIIEGRGLLEIGFFNYWDF